MNDIRFEYPWVLWGLAVLVPLCVWLLFFRDRQRTPTLIFSSKALFAGAPPSWGMRLRWLPRALRIITLTLVVIGLARPQGRADEEEQKAEGIDIVVALDLSSSMLAADFRPKDRITVAKKVIADFILSRKNDRFGLVVFGKEAFTQCPLTLDYSVIHNLLDQLEAFEPGSANDGTAIGNAVALGVARLRESEAKSRVVILLTDGDNNSGNVTPNQAAEVAKTTEVKVFPILVGKGGEVPVPVKTPFGTTTYVRANLPVNPELLKELAGITGGQFYRATDKQALEESFRKVIDEMEKSLLHGAAGFTNYEELFGWFVLPALLLLLLELGLSITRLRRFP